MIKIYDCFSDEKARKFNSALNNINLPPNYVGLVLDGMYNFESTPKWWDIALEELQTKWNANKLISNYKHLWILHPFSKDFKKKSTYTDMIKGGDWYYQALDITYNKLNPIIPGFAEDLKIRYFKSLYSFYADETIFEPNSNYQFVFENIKRYQTLSDDDKYYPVISIKKADYNQEPNPQIRGMVDQLIKENIKILYDTDVSIFDHTDRILNYLKLQF